MTDDSLVGLRQSFEDTMSVYDFHFHGILRELRRRKLRAKFSGDTDLHDELVKEENLIIERLRGMRNEVDEAVLNKEIIKKINVEIRKGADKAFKLLGEFKKTQEVLKKAKEIAELALSVFNNVKSILT